jgi:hypothetical protein
VPRNGQAELGLIQEAEKQIQTQTAVPSAVGKDSDEKCGGRAWEVA